MSFKLIMGSFIFIAISFVMGVLILFNMIPPFTYIIVSMAIGIVVPFILLFISITTNGVLEPFLSARIRGKTLLINETASRNFDIITGYEKDGMIETKRGFFLAVPVSMGSFPNGVRGAWTYFKYGVTLPRKIITAITELKKEGITDIHDLEKLETKLKETNQELVISG